MASILLQWRPVHPHPSWPEAKTDPVLWIDPTKFDRLWCRGDQWVGPKGTPGGLGDRYGRAGEWILSGKAINMCQIWVNDDGLGFIDGRHRFAWLRDQGLTTMPVQLSPESLAHGVSAIQAEARISQLTIPTPDG